MPGVIVTPLFRFFLPALSLCLLPGCASAATPSPALPPTAAWTGPLGYPYGHVVRIEGRWVKDEERRTYWEANIAGKNYFLVQKVNGSPCACRLQIQGESLRKQGDGYVGEGYQTGRFEGLVTGMKNQWPDGMKMQGQAWGFETVFVVVKPEEVVEGWGFGAAEKP